MMEYRQGMRSCSDDDNDDGNYDDDDSRSYHGKHKGTHMVAGACTGPGDNAATPSLSMILNALKNMESRMMRKLDEVEGEMRGKRLTPVEVWRNASELRTLRPTEEPRRDDASLEEILAQATTSEEEDEFTKFAMAKLDPDLDDIFANDGWVLGAFRSWKEDSGYGFLAVQSRSGLRDVFLARRPLQALDNNGYVAKIGDKLVARVTVDRRQGHTSDGRRKYRVKELVTMEAWRERHLKEAVAIRTTVAKAAEREREALAKPALPPGLAS